MIREIQPITHVDDLAPKSTIGGYSATWQEGGLKAVCELLPIDDQPSRGFTLEWGCSPQSGREQLGKRQADKGALLIVKVRELLIEKMLDAGWHSGDENIWQHTSRIAVPLTSDQGKPTQRRVLSIPAKAERRQSAGYTRTITARDVSFSCERCASKVTKAMFPGREPKYCDECAKEVIREQTRERVKRLRSGKKAVHFLDS